MAKPGRGRTRTREDFRNLLKSPPTTAGRQCVSRVGLFFLAPPHIPSLAYGTRAETGRRQSLGPARSKHRRPTAPSVDAIKSCMELVLPTTSYLRENEAKCYLKTPDSNDSTQHFAKSKTITKIYQKNNTDWGNTEEVLTPI